MFCRPLTECGTNLCWPNSPPTNYLPLFFPVLVDRTSFAMLDNGTMFDFQVDKRSLLDFKIDRSLFDFQGETVTVRLLGKQTVTLRLPGRQTTSKHWLPNIDELRSSVMSRSLLLVLTGDPPNLTIQSTQMPLTLFTIPSTSTNYDYFDIYHISSFPLSLPFLVLALVLLFLYPNKNGTTQKITPPNA